IAAKRPIFNDLIDACPDLLHPPQVGHLPQYVRRETPSVKNGRALEIGRCLLGSAGTMNWDIWQRANEQALEARDVRMIDRKEKNWARRGHTRALRATVGLGAPDVGMADAPTGSPFCSRSRQSLRISRRDNRQGDGRRNRRFLRGEMAPQW